MHQDHEFQHGNRIPAGRERVQFELSREVRQGLRLFSSKTQKSMSDLAIEARVDRASISHENFSNRRAG